MSIGKIIKVTSRYAGLVFWISGLPLRGLDYILSMLAAFVFFSELDLYLAVRLKNPRIRYEGRLNFYILLSTLLFITMLSCLTPPRFSLLFSILGIVIVIAIIRLWNRVESHWMEKEITLHERYYDLIHFPEPSTSWTIDRLKSTDFRRDALLAVAFLPGFFAMLLQSLHDIYGIFQVSSEAGRLEWIFFTGGEILKALPILDWSEIFEWQNPSHIEFVSTGLEKWSDPARIIVFAMRAAIEFLIINAIVKVVEITTMVRLGLRPASWTSVTDGRYNETTLIKWLNSPVEEVRRNGCMGLEYYATSNALEPLLFTFNHDDDRLVRHSSLEALGKVQNKLPAVDVRILDAWIRGLEGGDTFLHEGALKGISTFASHMYWELNLGESDRTWLPKGYRPITIKAEHVEMLKKLRDRVGELPKNEDKAPQDQTKYCYDNLTKLLHRLQDNVS